MISKVSIPTAGITLMVDIDGQPMTQVAVGAVSAVKGSTSIYFFMKVLIV